MGKHKPNKTKISDNSRNVSAKEQLRAALLMDKGLTKRKDRRRVRT